MFIISTTKNETRVARNNGNVNKAERVIEYFFFVFLKFFLNLSFCSFIFFWYRSQVFLGRKIKCRRKRGEEGCERKGNQQLKKPPAEQNNSQEGATRKKSLRGHPLHARELGVEGGSDAELQVGKPKGTFGAGTPQCSHIDRKPSCGHGGVGGTDGAGVPRALSLPQAISVNPALR